MANQFGIPQEVERRLRQKFTLCAYCRREMQKYAGVRGCPSDKATIEHLNRNGPFYWSDGLNEDDLVICCGSCNSSRGQKSLASWFASSYCVQRRITASTVAEEVKQYLNRQTSADSIGVGRAVVELVLGVCSSDGCHAEQGTAAEQPHD